MWDKLELRCSFRQGRDQPREHVNGQRRNNAESQTPAERVREFMAKIDDVLSVSNYLSCSHKDFLTTDLLVRSNSATPSFFSSLPSWVLKVG